MMQKRIVGTTVEPTTVAGAIAQAAPSTFAPMIVVRVDTVLSEVDVPKAAGLATQSWLTVAVVAQAIFVTETNAHIAVVAMLIHKAVLAGMVVTNTPITTHIANVQGDTQGDTNAQEVEGPIARTQPAQLMQQGITRPVAMVAINTPMATLIVNARVVEIRGLIGAQAPAQAVTIWLTANTVAAVQATNTIIAAEMAVNQSRAVPTVNAKTDAPEDKLGVMEAIMPTFTPAVEEMDITQAAGETMHTVENDVQAPPLFVLRQEKQMPFAKPEIVSQRLAKSSNTVLISAEPIKGLKQAAKQQHSVTTDIDAITEIYNMPTIAQTTKSANMAVTCTTIIPTVNAKEEPLTQVVKVAPPQVHTATEDIVH